MDTPVIQKKRGLSPVWILPLVALCIGGWLLYTSYRDAGIRIVIHFQNAEGITPGKTQVMYKGVAVGLVEEITVDEDLQGVSLSVTMDKKARKGLVEDTSFWVVRPEISEGRIRGLETLLSGGYIAVQPGTSKVQVRRFEGLADPPGLPPGSPGLHITLRAESLYSLQKGSSVYSKNLKIGQVQDYHLAEDGSILIELYIEPDFSHLIQLGTRFWNASGLSFEGNLQSGFSLHMQSMAALVYGGIACGTPESLIETSPPATNGMVFQLYSNYDAAEYGLAMTLQLASGGGIVEGKTKVVYRGLEAGVVKKVRINSDANHTVTAEILLDPRAESILKQGTRFWVVRPEVSIDGIRNLDTIIAGPYITFNPGSGEFQDNFIVEEGPIPRPPKRPGRHYTLVAEDSGSLEAGAPLFYKKMIVGEVRSIAFGPDAESVQIDIRIYDDYAYLVRRDTVFWNVSGLEIDASFSRINVSLSSIKSLLAGGIAFANPEKKKKRLLESPPAKEGDFFPLYANYSQAVKTTPWLQAQGLILQLTSSDNNGFSIGSPVLYKRMPVGEVISSSLSEDNQTLVIEVLVRKEYAKLIHTDTVFYAHSGIRLNADFFGVEIKVGPLSTILSGGISFLSPPGGKAVESGHSFVLYADYEEAVNRENVAITIHLDQAGGIREKTRITSQGIQIGSIRKLRFAPDMNGVIAEASVLPEAADLFRQTTRLRLVKPAISLIGISHLETVLTGPYIEVVSGDGPLRKDFTLSTIQSGADTYDGLNIILETSRLGSLRINSPVSYRQVQVGRVTGFSLSPGARQVWVRVNIAPPYANLVHAGTRFWLASGIRASWGLFSGFDLKSESMEAVLAGGIAFATPGGEEMGEVAGDNHHFTLYEKNEQSWLDWSPEIMLNEGAKETGKVVKPMHDDNTIQ